MGVRSSLAGATGSGEPPYMNTVTNLSGPLQKSKGS